MNIECKFKFESIEEMQNFMAKLSGNTTVAEQAEAPVAKPAAKVKATAKKVEPTLVATTAESVAPVAEASNPFAAMPTTPVAAPVVETPVAAAPTISREQILVNVKSFLDAIGTMGLQPADAAAMFAEHFFVPSGIAQVRISELDDTQLNKFHQVLTTTIVAAAKAKAAATSSLV